MIKIPMIDIKIITDTPIWTGNFDAKTEGIKETGIMGSLRWWYEAILRGFGCEICDPTTNKCKYNECLPKKTGIATDGFYKDERKDKVVVCPACQLFGCTGWAKRFRMRWYEDDNNKFNLDNPDRQGTYKHTENGGKRYDGYYITSRQQDKQNGECRATFYPTTKEIGEILSYLIIFALRWGGFGARPQFGYGMCHVKNIEDITKNYIPKIHAPKIFNKVNPKHFNEKPNLKDFFFSEFNPNFLGNSKRLEDFNYKVIETKYGIRKDIRENTYIPSSVRHFVCGEVYRDKKNASKIFISRPFKKDKNETITLRGYLPLNPSIDKYNRAEILDTIYNFIPEESLYKWIEFMAGDTYEDWLYVLIEDLYIPAKFKL